MLLSRGRRWETTSEKRGVWPLLTDCGTCTRTRLTISRRAREAGVRAPACGPIKIVQVCDPDQILTLTAHLDKMVVSTKCACETTMRQHLDNIEHVNTEQFVTRARLSSTILLRSAAAVGLLKHFQSQFSRATCGRPRSIVFDCRPTAVRSDPQAPNQAIPKHSRPFMCLLRALLARAPSVPTSLPQGSPLCLIAFMVWRCRRLDRRRRPERVV